MTNTESVREAAAIFVGANFRTEYPLSKVTDSLTDLLLAREAVAQEEVLQNLYQLARSRERAILKVSGNEAHSAIVALGFSESIEGILLNMGVELQAEGGE